MFRRRADALYLLLLTEPFPKKLSYSSKALEPLFKTISLDQIKRFLTEFTAFRTRYYRSETGKQSQQFLLRVLKEVSCSRTPPIRVHAADYRAASSPDRSSLVILRCPSLCASLSIPGDKTPSLSASSPMTEILQTRASSSSVHIRTLPICCPSCPLVEPTTMDPAHRPSSRHSRA